MPPQNKSILLTNLSLCQRSGSELHILELSKRFKEAGWDVSCFTLLEALPISACFHDLGVKVITPETADELEGHYDVLFAQHHLASEYLWTMESTTFGKVIVSILGLPSVTSHEGLPFFANSANLIVFVSEEARNACKEGIDSNIPSFIFPNYFTSDFLLKEAPHVKTEAPRRVAAISNHVPQEVRELKPLFADRHIAMDFLGYEDQSIEITKETLGQYDLVISIGRTAQCCMAAKIPFYCYDHFGGPGYINSNNLRKHAKSNFSGRSEPRKANAKELLGDILDNYSKAVRELDELQKLAKTRFSLDQLFPMLINKIDQAACFTQERTLHITQAKKHEILNRCREYETSYLHQIGTCQIFYLTPNSKGTLSERDSLKIKYRYNTEITIPLDKVQRNDVQIVRFDPDDKPCICSLTASQAKAANGLLGKSPEGNEIFLSDDPYYLIRAEECLTFLTKPIRNPLPLVRCELEKLQEQNCSLKGELALFDPREGSIKKLATNLVLLCFHRIVSLIQRPKA